MYFQRAFTFGSAGVTSTEAGTVSGPRHRGWLGRQQGRPDDRIIVSVPEQPSSEMQLVTVKSERPHTWYFMAYFSTQGVGII